MSPVKDGGPAYPQPPDYYRASQNRDGDWDIASGVDSPSAGMTKREWYAGQALAGLLSEQDGTWAWEAARTARTAFELADAMIAEQAKGGAS